MKKNGRSLRGGVSRGQEDGIGDTRIIKEGREFSLKERRR